MLPTSSPPLVGPFQDELGSPALAFVRLLVHLLSLDKSLEDEVRLLRRSLLRLVGVDEFSPAAKWVDPCISFRLHDVICRWAGGGARGRQLS
jgi:DNA polymerase epsilon subunit 1